MSGAGAPRLAALEILRDVRNGAFADRAAARRLSHLDPRDRRLAQELAYGCVRLRARLDHELDALVDRPLARLEADVHDWLRLGLYQLRELRVPTHAAVHASVDGVRSTVGDRGTGIVNAVLRAAARVEDRDAMFPAPERDPLGHLATYGSHPEWLLRRWLDRWPVERVVRLVESNNARPSVTLRWLGPEPGGSRGGGAQDAARIDPLSEWPRCFELAAGDPGPVLSRLPVIVQDPAASAVVDYVGEGAGSPLVDACAGPGGKAVALAHETGVHPLVASDVSFVRIGRVLDSARRTGTRVAPLVMDARRPAVRAASTVLVDAPCSGTGVLRRRPDLRWRVDPERLAGLVTLQREILDGCAEMVAPGGLLVYATCSLEREENEVQVENFLRRHDRFRRDPAPGDSSLPADILGSDGALRVFPPDRGTDGSFAVRLRRRAAPRP